MFFKSYVTSYSTVSEVNYYILYQHISMVVTKICKIKMDFKTLSSKKAVLQYVLNLGEVLSKLDFMRSVRAWARPFSTVSRAASILPCSTRTLHKPVYANWYWIRKSTFHSSLDFRITLKELNKVMQASWYSTALGSPFSDSKNAS